MQFRTTEQIFKPSTDFFDDNWMDSNKIILPPKTEWDYQREMKIEDVNLWEIIYEQSGGIAMYASWDPYAEFYMIRAGWQKEALGWGTETYYGKGAQKMIRQRAKELGIQVTEQKIWVEPDDMWIYQ